MPAKRPLSVRIEELEAKLIQLKLEQEITSLQAQMRSVRPVRKRVPRQRRQEQAELLPKRKATAKAKRKTASRKS